MSSQPIGAPRVALVYDVFRDTALRQHTGRHVVTGAFAAQLIAYLRDALGRDPTPGDVYAACRIVHAGAPRSCVGCDEFETRERPLHDWRIAYPGADELAPALYCGACGELAAAGLADYILSAELYAEGEPA